MRETVYFATLIILQIIIFFAIFRNTILAFGSFLDTFQKIADAATNTKGTVYTPARTPFGIFLPLVRQGFFLVVGHWTVVFLAVMLI